jgi:beta-glucosidase
MSKVQDIVKKMTNEEKALLLSGEDFWHLVTFEKYDLPRIMVADGPHGLRKQPDKEDHLGQNGSVPATCFPPACTTACSFDQELIYKMGEALAEECHDQEVSVLLGPGANHKRSPLCGRNFEYFSEDPVLTGAMATSFVNGVQSKDIGTSLKHFACNSQEYARFLSDSIVDERALREIYLRAYENVVKKSQPWTIMTAYNKINGTYCSENKWLMEDVARGEWGYNGIFVTDWGAMHDPVESYKNGQELEMPGSCKGTDKLILTAVETGQISQKTLDKHAERIVELILKSAEARKQSVTCDMAALLKLAQHIAEESAVLLKNEELLPYKRKGQFAVIGNMAKHPRYQGAGSSRINPYELDNAYDAFTSLGLDFDYADGYNRFVSEPVDTLIREAAEKAKGKDIVFVFAGLPESYESEGYDRDTLDMPPAHNKLIEAVAAVNENVVVILQCGSAVTMPWKDQVKAILLTYLGGCQGGKAAVNLLIGNANPSGKLAETFPLKLSDTPCYKHFANDKFVAQYRESIFTGYRYYDTAAKEVLYPFGHGLSYTAFEYSDLKLSSDSISEKDTLTVTLKIKNTGELAGKETVQLYVSHKDPTVFKAAKELKAFAKVALAAGEEKEVSFELNADAFNYYNVRIHEWHVESGDYEILVGASSRDIRLSALVHINTATEYEAPDYRSMVPSYYSLPHTEGILDLPESDFLALVGKPLPEKRPVRPFHLNSAVFELRTTFIGRIFVFFAKKMAVKSLIINEGDDMEKMVDATIMDLPLRAIGMSGSFTREGINGLVEIFNGHLIRGLKLLTKKQK